MHYITNDASKRRIHPLVIFLGILAFAALLALAGWQYREHQTISQGQAASQVYESMLTAVKQNDAKRAQREAHRLVEEYPDTPYMNLAAMLLARIHIEKRDIPGAIEDLRGVIAKGGNTPFAHIARVRISRLMAAEGQYAEALALLEEEKKPGGFTAMYEEAKGDLYAKMNQPNKARLAYQTAVKATPAGVNSPVIPLKTADLSETQEN